MRPKKLKKFGIVSKYETKEVQNTARKIKEHLEKKRAKVYCSEGLAEKLDSKKKINFDKPKVDAILTIGGDGTLLKTVRELNGSKVPVVGVMRGRVGFLTEISHNIEKYLDKLLEGDYYIDTRKKLEVSVNGKRAGDVLNEVVVTTSTPAKMQIFDISVHGDWIDKIDADGIIIATPTGSTAYSMSAGGPIIDPWSKTYAIVPMLPLRLSARSIVVPSNAKTVIQTKTKRKSMVVMDGYYGPKISDTDKVEIKESKNSAYLIKFKKDFFQKVRRKLR